MFISPNLSHGSALPVPGRTGTYDVALKILPLYMRTNKEQKKNGVRDGGEISANSSSFYVTLWINS